MSDEKLESIAKKVKAGKYWGPEGAVADHLKLFADQTIHQIPVQEPKLGQRIALISTLLRARDSAQADFTRSPFTSMGHLSMCRGEMRPHIEELYRFQKHIGLGKYTELTAEQAYIASSGLLNWSLKILSSNDYRAAAIAYAQFSYDLTRDAPVAAHTHALAGITLAEAALDEHRTDDASQLLEEIQQRAPHITDAAEQSRVYQGIADICDRLKRWPEMHLALHAMKQVPDVPPDVQEERGGA